MYTFLLFSCLVEVGGAVGPEGESGCLLPAHKGHPAVAKQAVRVYELTKRQVDGVARPLWGEA